MADASRCCSASVCLLNRWTDHAKLTLNWLTTILLILFAAIRLPSAKWQTNETEFVVIYNYEIFVSILQLKKMLN